MVYTVAGKGGLVREVLLPHGLAIGRSLRVRRQPEPGFARVDLLRGRVSERLQERNQTQSTMRSGKVPSAQVSIETGQLHHEVPAKCHYRPPGAGARAAFSVAFTVRFVTFSVVMGDGKGAWFPCRNELMPRKPATIIQKTAPGPPTPTCIWRRRGVAPSPGSSFGGGIPPPLDLVLEILSRYVPLSPTIGRLVPPRAPFLAPFSPSD